LQKTGHSSTECRNGRRRCYRCHGGPSASMALRWLIATCCCRAQAFASPILRIIKILTKLQEPDIRSVKEQTLNFGIRTTQPGDMRSAEKGVPGYTISRPLARIKITSLCAVRKRGDMQSNSSRPQMTAELLEVQWKGREFNATPRSKRSQVLKATGNRGHF
jgi:hypothetical protein